MHLALSLLCTYVHIHDGDIAMLSVTEIPHEMSSPFAVQFLYTTSYVWLSSNWYSHQIIILLKSDGGS
jgi:hypothetical protein